MNALQPSPFRILYAGLLLSAWSWTCSLGQSTAPPPTKSGYTGDATLEGPASVQGDLLADDKDVGALLPLTATARRSAATGAAPTKSGFSTDPGMEGADSVQEDLALDDVDTGAVFRPPLLDGVLDPWWAFKRRLNEKLGLQLQLSYQALYQDADAAVTEDEAAAGRFEFQGSWTLLGRHTENPGSLVFRVEERHRLGTDIAPSSLGSQFGSIHQSGTGFSDFGTQLRELSWRQTAADGRAKFGFGKISALGWYGGHALSSPKRGFQNTAMLGSLSVAPTSRGLGAVAGSRIGESFVGVAGIHDANAKSASNPFDTIEEGEFFYSAELRWIPTSWDRRRWDQVRLRGWYQDSREEAGIPSGHGATFVASRLFDDFYMPFLFGGLSDGDASVMEADLTAGIGFAFNTKHRAARDVLGIGVSWGKPSNGALREQYTSEIFYRFQLFQNIAFTPSVQYVVDPAMNSGEDEVWVGGIRGRMTF